MGKSTISMAIFNCYVSSPEGIPIFDGWTTQSFSLHPPVAETGARAEATPSSPKAQFVLWQMETMEGML